MKAKLIISVILILISVWGKAQVITTFAGIADSVGYSGDGGPAGACTFAGILGIAIDKKGQLFICDNANNVVRVVNPYGIVSTFAGNGSAGFYGDGGPATLAQLDRPGFIAIDTTGNVYIVDSNRIRKVDTTGNISTMAGTGVAGYSGDEGPATAAEISPGSIAVDQKNNIYFANGNNVRKIDASGIIHSVAGCDTCSFAGTSGPATGSWIGQVDGVTIDNYGNLYFSNIYNIVLKVDTTGMMSPFAGSYCANCYIYPNKYYGGDGGPATSAILNFPSGLAFDKYDNLYICDVNNSVIRKVSTNGNITTYAGTDTIGGYSGDGGPATGAKLGAPFNDFLDSTGNLYIADYANNVVRKVIKNGVAGIKNTTNSSKIIEAFPNPVEYVLHINGIQTVSRFRLLSLMGTESQNGILDIGNNSINLNSLPPGIYFLKITGSEGSETVTKILKL